MKRLFMIVAITMVAAAFVGLVGSAPSGVPTVSADSGARDYVYLIGVEPLCGLDPSACPAIAIAPNGDTIEITGEGTLSIHPKSVTGGGTFTHKDAAGNVLGSGNWTAEQLLGFHSYGSGAAQGLPDEFEGGHALIRVKLWVGGTPVATGVLRVTCLLGDKIPAGAAEGVRLAVHMKGAAINFNKEVSGFTLFILQ